MDLCVTQDHVGPGHSLRGGCFCQTYYSFIDSTASEMIGNRMWGFDMQQWAPGWDSNPVRLSQDKASVHGTPSLPTEPVGAPEENALMSIIQIKLIIRHELQTCTWLIHQCAGNYNTFPVSFSFLTFLFCLCLLVCFQSTWWTPGKVWFDFWVGLNHRHKDSSFLHFFQLAVGSVSYRGIIQWGCVQEYLSLRYPVCGVCCCYFNEYTVDWIQILNRDADSAFFLYWIWP